MKAVIIGSILVILMLVIIALSLLHNKTQIGGGKPKSFKMSEREFTRFNQLMDDEDYVHDHLSIDPNRAVEILASIRASKRLPFDLAKSYYDESILKLEKYHKYLQQQA